MIMMMMKPLARVESVQQLSSLPTSNSVPLLVHTTNTKIDEEERPLPPRQNDENRTSNYVDLHLRCHEENIGGFIGVQYHHNEGTTLSYWHTTTTSSSSS